MQKYRNVTAGAALIATLIVLTGCDLFKKASCPTCKPQVEKAAIAAEDSLLSIDGTPVLSKESFEDFYQMSLANAGPYGAPSKADVFKQVEAMAILDYHMGASGKNQTAEFKKELQRAYDSARWAVNTQNLAKELQESIDVSDKALAQFYKEQVGTNQAFDRPPFIKNAESIQLDAVEFPTKEAAQEFAKKAKGNFAGTAAAGGLTVKNLGNVSAQSQDVDFAIRLKARTIKPGDVEVVQATDKFFVIKAGPKQEAQYASFEEVKAMPQMTEMLGQFKKQMELEPAFMKRIEEYKKGLDITKNDEYFKADEEARKAQEEELMKMIQEQMQAQQGAQPAKAAVAA